MSTLDLGPIMDHAPGFVVVVARIAGLMLFAPILSSRSIPRFARVLTALALAAAVYPVVFGTLGTAGWGSRPLDLFALAPMLAGEAMIGASIGLMASMPMMAVQLAGLTMGQQIGLGMAQVVDPTSGIEGNELGQVLFVVALSAYLLLGGVEVVFGSLVHTFHTVPVALAEAHRPPVGIIVGMLTSAFDLAARVSMPILAIIFVENIAMGFIMKTIPALNIMSFGFPVRIVLGLGVLIAALPMTSEVMWSGIEAALGEVESWAITPVVGG